VAFYIYQHSIVQFKKYFFNFFKNLYTLILVLIHNLCSHYLNENIENFLCFSAESVFSETFKFLKEYFGDLLTLVLQYYTSGRSYYLYIHGLCCVEIENAIKLLHCVYDL